MKLRSANHRANMHVHQRVNSPWLMHFTQRYSPDAPRAICLPHAGCGASAFKSLTSAFFMDYEMLVVQYPGRETRLRDPYVRNLHDMVDAIVDVIVPYLTPPYVLFGHSMGAKIAYELVRKLKVLGHPLPEQLVVSCSPAPHHPVNLDQAYKGSDEEFIAYLRRLGGVPEELLAEKELVAFILPTLRADFELLGNYTTTQNDGPLACPLTAIYSPQDTSVTPEATAKWADLALDSFQHYSITGGHFYFPKQQDTLLDILGADGQT